jgi:hypothetical protein
MNALAGGGVPQADAQRIFALGRRSLRDEGNRIAVTSGDGRHDGLPGLDGDDIPRESGRALRPSSWRGIQ